MNADKIAAVNNIHRIINEQIEEEPKRTTNLTDSATNTTETTAPQPRTTESTTTDTPPIKYAPIELTTHNIHFHEESPVLSITAHGEHIATCGNDGAVRLWKCTFKEDILLENVYHTAANSSAQLEYVKDLSVGAAGVNCIRFGAVDGALVLALCTDSGKVVVIVDPLGEKSREVVVRGAGAVAAFEVCWGAGLLFAGFGDGTVEAYELCVKTAVGAAAEGTAAEGTSKAAAVAVGRTGSVNPSGTTVQGLAFNSRHGLLAVHTLSKTVRVYSVALAAGTTLAGKAIQFISIAEHTANVDGAHGLFKRLAFFDDRLAIFTKNGTVSVFSAPFSPENILLRIGPLESPVVCAKAHGAYFFVCTKRGMHAFRKDCHLFSVQNACFMTITDIAVLKGTVFLSSLDGFLASVRLDKCTALSDIACAGQEPLLDTA